MLRGNNDNLKKHEQDEKETQKKRKKKRRSLDLNPMRTRRMTRLSTEATAEKSRKLLTATPDECCFCSCIYGAKKMAKITKALAEG